MTNNGTIYALSVRQPLASMIAFGTKTIEWRTYPWEYRGKLLIVASKTVRYKTPCGNYLPFGQAVATVDIVGCRPMTWDDLWNAGCEHLEDDLSPGDITGFAWELANPQEIEPFDLAGKLRPWKWDHSHQIVYAPGWHDARYTYDQ